MEFENPKGGLKWNAQKMDRRTWCLERFALVRQSVILPDVVLLIGPADHSDLILPLSGPADHRWHTGGSGHDPDHGHVDRRSVG